MSKRIEDRNFFPTGFSSAEDQPFCLPIGKAVKLLSVLSNDVRLRALMRLAEDDAATVEAIASLEGLTLSTVHAHMAILHRAGLLKRERRKNTLVFSITERGKTLLAAL